MSKYKFNRQYYTPIQMKIPVDLEKIIEISVPIYTFNEIMDKVDLRKYLVGNCEIDISQLKMHKKK